MIACLGLTPREGSDVASCERSERATMFKFKVIKHFNRTSVETMRRCCRVILLFQLDNSNLKQENNFRACCFVAPFFHRLTCSQIIFADMARGDVLCFHENHLQQQLEMVKSEKEREYNKEKPKWENMQFSVDKWRWDCTSAPHHLLLLNHKFHSLFFLAFICEENEMYGEEWYEYEVGFFFLFCLDFSLRSGDCAWMMSIQNTNQDESLC